MSEIFKALTSWKFKPILQEFLTKAYAVLLSLSNVEFKDITVNVSTKYEDLSNVFEKTENLIFSDHNLYDHAIDLKSEKTSSFNLLYNLSAMKLSMFRKYLEWNL